MNAVCGLEGIAISDWTVAVVMALVQKDEKEAMNVGDLLRLLGLFSEQNARLTQVQVLNLFRTVVKKYGKQLASQKGYLQSLLCMYKGWQANQQGKEAQTTYANQYRCFHNLVILVLKQ